MCELMMSVEHFLRFCNVFMMIKKNCAINLFLDVFPSLISCEKLSIKKLFCYFIIRNCGRKIKSFMTNAYLCKFIAKIICEKKLNLIFIDSKKVFIYFIYWRVNKCKKNWWLSRNETILCYLIMMLMIIAWCWHKIFSDFILLQEI